MAKAHRRDQNKQTECESADKTVFVNGFKYRRGPSGERAEESEDRGEPLASTCTRVRWTGVCHCARTADWLLRNL